MLEAPLDKPATWVQSACRETWAVWFLGHVQTGGHIEQIHNRISEDPYARHRDFQVQVLEAQAP